VLSVSPQGSVREGAANPSLAKRMMQSARCGATE
jgi:hypothetical protein